MKRAAIYIVAGALGVATLADAAPPAQAAEQAASPASLDQLRESVRGEALRALSTGDLEQVHRRRYRHRHYRYYRYRYYRYRPYRYRYYRHRHYRGPGIYFGLGFY